MFSEKYHNFTYVSSGMYLMTTCGKSGIQAVYNYKNKDFVFTRGRQNVTSETTQSRSFDLISPSCNSLWGFKWDMSDGPYEVSIPLQAHNHANLQETEKLHLENKAAFNFKY